MRYFLNFQFGWVKLNLHKVKGYETLRQKRP